MNIIADYSVQALSYSKHFCMHAARGWVCVRSELPDNYAQSLTLTITLTVTLTK